MVGGSTVADYFALMRNSRLNSWDPLLNELLSERLLTALWKIIVRMKQDNEGIIK